VLISNIIGGLGNQMFQYAVARAQSIRLNTRLCLDITGFEASSIHQGFELKRVFNLDSEIASEDDLRDVLGWQRHSLVRRVVSRSNFTRLKRKNFILEPHFEYWNGIESIPQSCHLSGYWQSERYFLSSVNAIRNDFSFVLPLDNENRDLAARISQVNAVSLHVRRGDYISNPQNTGIYHACSAAYYEAAIKRISQDVTRPHFFVFSDDIEWVKKFLQIQGQIEYISNNKGENSYKDMHLMSLCRHHILANSSFSWWGAWLNARPTKIVVAPRKWFVKPVNTKDLLPHAWVQL
jgi:Glycosyl transferase family 11